MVSYPPCQLRNRICSLFCQSCGVCGFHHLGVISLKQEFIFRMGKKGRNTKTVDANSPLLLFLYYWLTSQFHNFINLCQIPHLSHLYNAWSLHLRDYNWPKVSQQVAVLNKHLSYSFTRVNPTFLSLYHTSWMTERKKGPRAEETTTSSWRSSSCGSPPRVCKTLVL